MNITLPSSSWLFTRHGLLVTETKVVLFEWKRGHFTKLTECVNDNQGLIDFANYMKAKGKRLNNKSINVCVSVVGEDYRFEKVAHLVGKYRTDMLKRRFAQLFRGTSYHMAQHQGRESIGRRQDYYLFCGILSNEKVQPWVKEVVRWNMNVAGVHLGSMLSQTLFSHVVDSKEGVNVVSLCMEDGVIRHNFYIDGNLRFSRLSRGSENALPQDIYRLVRSEIEKTSQYLVSVKLIPNNAKIKAYIVCADDILDSLKDVTSQSDSERVSMTPVSARVVGGVIGIKKPIEEYGRDSSLMCNEMARSFRLSQLAALDQVRYYLVESSAIVASIAVVLWGAFNLLQRSIETAVSYSQYSIENTKLASNVTELKNDYQNLVNEFVQPPSTSENMRASVNVLNHVVDVDLNPGKLLLFLSKQVANNPPLTISKLEWYVSNEQDNFSGEYSFANGRKYYEVLEVRGLLDEDFDSEQAYDLYTAMIKKINARPDMDVIEVNKPSLVEAGGSLVGTLDIDTDIRSQLNAYTNNEFTFRIVWDPGFDLSKTSDSDDA